MKKIAVVILNWNGKSLLEKFLPFVVKYSGRKDSEIIVADNSSTDDSVIFLTQNYPQIRIISLPENYGYAKGYNEALSKVDAEYLILLNSDVEVTEGWLDPIIRCFEQHAEVAALQPKILSYRNREKFEYAGAAGGFIDKYGYPFCRGRILNAIEKDHKQYDEITEIFWASGACLAIRQKDFWDAGGFDPIFFAHMEEIDLCWRLNARARKVVCLPQSVVYHLGAATLSKENPRKTFLNFRNNMLMLYKNLPEKELNKVFNTRLFLNYLALLQMLLTGQVKNAKAILAAHKDIKKLMPEYKSTREENLLKTIKQDIPTIYKSSIIWSFYGKGIKTYRQLVAK